MHFWGKWELSPRKDCCVSFILYQWHGVLVTFRHYIFVFEPSSIPEIWACSPFVLVTLKFTCQTCGPIAYVHRVCSAYLKCEHYLIHYKLSYYTFIAYINWSFVLCVDAYCYELCCIINGIRWDSLWELIYEIICMTNGWPKWLTGRRCACCSKIQNDNEICGWLHIEVSFFAYV